MQSFQSRFLANFVSSIEKMQAMLESCLADSPADAAVVKTVLVVFPFVSKDGAVILPG